MRVFPSVKQPAEWIESLESRELFSVTISPTAVTAPEKVNRKTVFATFTTADPAPLKVKNYTATVAFGDGSHAKAKVALIGSTFTVTAGRNYKKQGFFTYSVTIKDKVDKSVTTASGIATVTSSSGSPNTDLTTNDASYLKDAYGGSFSKSGLNYTNGTVTATRVGDDADQIWPLSGSIVSAQAIGAFSLDSEDFGYLPGASGGSFNSLFTITGKNAAVTGSSGALDVSGPFRLALSSGGNIFSSNAIENVDGRDHLITYEITGTPGQTSTQKKYLLFWEDNVSSVSDFDYNDAIVEVTTNAT